MLLETISLYPQTNNLSARKQGPQSSTFTEDSNPRLAATRNPPVRSGAT